MEYWASVQETLLNKRGDCEDGAILLFCLARAAGISPEQIFIAAGDVKGGGHCWVKYTSTRFPLVSYFIDWCYWIDSTSIRNRNSFIDYKGEITPNDKYKKYWFISNDEKSSTKFNW